MTCRERNDSPQPITGHNEQHGSLAVPDPPLACSQPYREGVAMKSGWGERLTETTCLFLCLIPPLFFQPPLILINTNSPSSRPGVTFQTLLFC